MKRFGPFLLGLIVGASVMFLAMNYHVVRSKEGLHLIPKIAAKFDQPYVDIRNFTLEDWNRHQALALAIVKSKDSNLLKDSAFDQFRQSTQSLLKKIMGE